MNSIEKIKQKALEDNVPIIMDDTLDEIKKILLEEKPTKILEIGTAVGYSAICFCNILNNDVKITTIERDELRAKEAMQNIKDMKLQNNIELLIGDAVEILLSIEEKYDFIFIDASKGKYPFFLEQAIRVSNNNAIIVADNILYEGYVLGDYNKHKQRTAVRNLREYIKKITENPNLDTKILEVGDGLAVSRVI